MSVSALGVWRSADASLLRRPGAERVILVLRVSRARVYQAARAGERGGMSLNIVDLNLTDVHPRAAEVFALAQSGETWHSIAEKTGMSENGVYLVARALRDAGILQRRASPKARGPAKRAETAKLKCLRCGGMFQSLDRRCNRICRRCKENPA